MVDLHFPVRRATPKAVHGSRAERDPGGVAQLGVRSDDLGQTSDACRPAGHDALAELLCGDLDVAGLGGGPHEVDGVLDAVDEPGRVEVVAEGQRAPEELLTIERCQETVRNLEPWQRDHADRQVEAGGRRRGGRMSPSAGDVQHVADLEGDFVQGATRLELVRCVLGQRIVDRRLPQLPVLGAVHLGDDHVVVVIVRVEALGVRGRQERVDVDHLPDLLLEIECEAVDRRDPSVQAVQHDGVATIEPGDGFVGIEPHRRCAAHGLPPAFRRGLCGAPDLVGHPSVERHLEYSCADEAISGFDAEQVIESAGSPEQDLTSPMMIDEGVRAAEEPLERKLAGWLHQPFSLNSPTVHRDATCTRPLVMFWLSRCAALS